MYEPLQEKYNVVSIDTLIEAGIYKIEDNKIINTRTNNEAEDYIYEYYITDRVPEIMHKKIDSHLRAYNLKKFHNEYTKYHSALLELGFSNAVLNEYYIPARQNGKSRKSIEQMEEHFNAVVGMTNKPEINKISPIDIDNIIDEDKFEEYINESIGKIKNKEVKDKIVHIMSYNKDNIVTIDNMNPVYIVTVSGKTMFSNIVKKVTNSNYSHAALGFHHDLKELYSFNISNHLGDKKKKGIGGINLESIDGYKKTNPDSELTVLTLFLKDEHYQKLKDNVNYYIENADKTRYGFTNLFNIILKQGTEKKNQLNMICSQFVDKMFKMIDLDLSNKSSSLTTPADLSRIVHNKVYKVYEGTISKYNPKEIGNKIRKLGSIYDPIMEQLLLEANSLSVEFDKEGNLFIKNIKKLNFDDEYKKSNKLLKVYKKNNNLEAIKYELCKLWYLNMECLNRIQRETDDTKKSYYIGMRAKFLNDFHIYLDYATQQDKDFNFESYYNSSIFSNDVKISKHTLKHGLEFIKLISKL